jgi:AraC-like DNA-binding protein
VATVAGRVGYGSDVAFAAAFKREVGTSPGAYRRLSTPPAGDPNAVA